jgi:hypothetical protein
MLRNVLKKYPEVMFFNGHSHWTMDSVGNMFEGDSKLPCRIFNCASVAYLWSGYNVVTGEHLNGSQGYMIKLYDGKLYVLGRDFAKGEWIPAAQYCIVLKEAEPETEAPTEAESEAPDEPAETPETVTETDSVTVPDTVPDTEVGAAPDTDTAHATEPVAEKGCGSVVSLAVVCLMFPVGLFVIYKRKN